MKRTCLFCLVLLIMICGTAFQAAADDTPSPAQVFTKQHEAIIAAGEADIKRIKRENLALQSEIERTQKAVDDADAILEKEKKKFNSLKQAETRIRGEIQAEIQMVNAIDRAGRHAVLKMLRQLKDAPPVAGLQPQMDLVSAWVGGDVFPGDTAVTALGELLLGMIAASGEIKTKAGSWVGASGQQVHGTIIRIGLMGAVGVSDNGAAFLVPRADGAGLKSATNNIPSDYAGAIERYAGGRGTHLPLDLSRGKVFSLLDKQNDTMDWLHKGGVMAWPLVIIALAATLLALFQGIFLWYQTPASPALRKTLTDLNKNEGKHRLLDTEKRRNPSARAALRLFALSKDEPITSEAMDQALLSELPRLERFLSSLQVMAAVAPMIGLLGTVTGMIHAFQVLSLYGTTDPQLMSGGISEALITTQMGLGIAIPIMAFHHILDWRVSRLTDDMSVVMASCKSAWSGDVS